MFSSAYRSKTKFSGQLNDFHISAGIRAKVYRAHKPKAKRERKSTAAAGWTKGAVQATKGWSAGEKNVFIRMVECHAGLEIAPYISYAMRRETLFSTSQKSRTNGRGGRQEGGRDWNKGSGFVCGGRERGSEPARFPPTF